MENKIVVVDSEPYCIWEHSIKDQNQLFLEKIDVGYFEYILKAHAFHALSDEESKEDNIRASVALRAALNQSMEMMFSLLCAFLQSPKCTYAWMTLCKNSQLFNILQRINCVDNNLHHELNIKDISWNSISKAVFHDIIFEGDFEDTAGLFADFWRKCASDFCDENKTKEYNSIKHGLRINPGGFSFSLGIEEEAGKPAPAKNMTTLHNSKYGSSFLKLLPSDEIKGNRSRVSKEVSLSWEMENIITQIKLIIMSIKNITLRLKQLNECNTNQNFIRPKNDDIFEDAWKYVPAIQNLEMQIGSNGPQPISTSRKELLAQVAKFRVNKIAE